jgi:glucose/arabinose dehydrogenase
MVACSTKGGGDGTGGGPPAGTGGSGAGGSGGTPGVGGSDTGAGGNGTATGGAGSGGAPNSSGGSPNGTGGAGSGGAPTACDATSAPAITRLGYETVVESDDFTVMVYAAQPPGSQDWYLVDALGYVRVFSGGTLQQTPFLDVSADVQDSTFGNDAPSGGSQNYDERGLLSIAFPPDYQETGKFYVTLIPTTIANDDTDHDYVLEYTRSSANPLVADPASRKVILDLEPGGDGYVEGTTFSYAKYHNASTVVFGPDGMLYVGMGDGGGDCNAARPGVPQDVSSPYGKILRLDPKQPAPYAAAGNPFADGGDARVFHYGVRNPFRFSFDSENGDLYIGEVGQWSHDSVAFAPGGSMGLNFGWPAFEGTQENPNPNGQCASTTELRSGSTRKDPIFNLAHGSDGGVSNLIVAIVGGKVYRGSAIPSLYGTYLFGEFYPNRPMRALNQCGDQTSPVLEIDKVCDPNTPNEPCFVPVGGAADLRQVGAVVQGNDGELYLPANGNALLRIVPAP